MLYAWIVCELKLRFDAISQYHKQDPDHANPDIPRQGVQTNFNPPYNNSQRPAEPEVEVPVPWIRFRTDEALVEGILDHCSCPICDNVADVEDVRKEGAGDGGVVWLYVEAVLLCRGEQRQSVRF